MSPWPESSTWAVAEEPPLLLDSLGARPCRLIAARVCLPAGESFDECAPGLDHVGFTVAERREPARWEEHPTVLRADHTPVTRITTRIVADRAA